MKAELVRTRVPLLPSDLHFTSVARQQKQLPATDNSRCREKTTKNMSSSPEEEEVGPSIDSADPEERIAARRLRIQKRIEAQKR